MGWPPAFHRQDGPMAFGMGTPSQGAQSPAALLPPPSLIQRVSVPILHGTDPVFPRFAGV